jgi:hypothetical protein
MALVLARQQHGTGTGTEPGHDSTRHPLQWEQQRAGHGNNASAFIVTAIAYRIGVSTADDGVDDTEAPVLKFLFHRTGRADPHQAVSIVPRSITFYQSFSNVFLTINQRIIF